MGVTDYHSTQNEDLAKIPYVVYQLSEARHKRKEKMLAIALAVSVAFIFFSNIMLH